MKIKIIILLTIFSFTELSAQLKNEFIVVFGNEFIQTKIDLYQNTENSLLPYLNLVLSKVYRLKPIKIDEMQVFFKDNYIDEGGAVELIKKTRPEIRYVLFYTAKTNLITDFGYENIPPSIEAELVLSIYDLTINESYYSSGTTGAIFSPGSLCESDIINASKAALRYFTNEKNSENCLVLLKSIFVNF